MKHFFILGLIAIILWTFIGSHNNKKTPQFKSSLVIAPVVDEIVAVGINLPTGTMITPGNVATGKYPVVAFQVNPGQFILEVPRRLGHLSQFDVNHSGILDAQDPVFSHLAIGFISSDGTKIKFSSFKDIGIRAVILDMKHIAIQQKAGLPPGEWDVHNVYLMSDGSRWTSYHVGLPSSFIDGLSTIDPNQKIVQLAP